MTKLKEKKTSFWRELFRKRVQIKVLSGGHALTDLDEAKGILKNVALLKGDKSGEVIAVSMYGRKTFTFKRISWERNESRSAGKAAAGAIVAGALTGGLGAIAGAAIGGRKKDNSTAFIYLLDDLDEEVEIHIECTKQLYTEIDRLPW